jgi:hypothetical protein
MVLVSTNYESLQYVFDILKNKKSEYNLPCLVFIDNNFIYPKERDNIYFVQISGETNGNFTNLLNRKFETLLMQKLTPYSIDIMCRDWNVAMEVYFEQYSSSTKGHIIIDNTGEVVVNKKTHIDTEGFQKPWKLKNILK